MLPTIQLGDRVIAEKLTYRFPRAPDKATSSSSRTRGLAADPDQARDRAEGQTVDFEDGKVYVDGEPLYEPYTHGKPSLPLNPRSPTRSTSPTATCGDG